MSFLMYVTILCNLCKSIVYFNMIYQENGTCKSNFLLVIQEISNKYWRNCNFDFPVSNTMNTQHSTSPMVTLQPEVLLVFKMQVETIKYVHT